VGLLQVRKGLSGLLAIGVDDTQIVVGLREVVLQFDDLGQQSLCLLGVGLLLGQFGLSLLELLDRLLFDARLLSEFLDPGFLDSLLLFVLILGGGVLSAPARRGHPDAADQ